MLVLILSMETSKDEGETLDRLRDCMDRRGYSSMKIGLRIPARSAERGPLIECVHHDRVTQLQAGCSADRPQADVSPCNLQEGECISHGVGPWPSSANLIGVGATYSCTFT